MVPPFCMVYDSSGYASGFGAICISSKKLYGGWYGSGCGNYLFLYTLRFSEWNFVFAHVVRISFSDL
jgi:hypothetical protein